MGPLSSSGYTHCLIPRLKSIFWGCKNFSRVNGVLCPVHFALSGCVNDPRGTLISLLDFKRVVFLRSTCMTVVAPATRNTKLDHDHYAYVSQLTWRVRPPSSKVVADLEVSADPSRGFQRDTLSCSSIGTPGPNPESQSFSCGKRLCY